MNKSVMILATVLLSVVSLLIIGVSMYFSYNNQGVAYEVNIKKEHESIGVIFSNFKQGLDEIVQVPTMAKEDIGDVFRAALEGRYGSNGSQAVFQMITEQNPQIDPSLYKSIQTYIEGKRNELVLSNQKLIEQRAFYEQALRNKPSKWFLEFAGFPTIDINTAYLPIRTNGAIAVMASGIEPDVKPLR